MKKGSPEAKAFGAKMKALREAKKNDIKAEVKKETPEEEEVEKIIPKGISINPIVDSMREIIKGFFPTAEIRINSNGGKHAVEVIFNGNDTRAFVVGGGTVLPDTKSWCIKIENNIAGNPTHSVAGIGLQEKTKELPKELPKEFFTRE